MGIVELAAYVRSVVRASGLAREAEKQAVLLW